MKKIAALFALSVLLLSAACGKEPSPSGGNSPSASAAPAPASSAAQGGEAPEPEKPEPAVPYDSLADWYTGEQVDFSEIEGSLGETAEAYIVSVLAEGDSLIFRFTCREQVDIADEAAKEDAEAAFEAYYAENGGLVADAAAQVMEWSGMDDIMIYLEVMNADGIGAICFKQLA